MKNHGVSIVFSPRSGRRRAKAERPLRFLTGAFVYNKIADRGIIIQEVTL